MTINKTTDRISPRIKQLDTLRKQKKDREAREKKMGPGKFQPKTILRKKSDN